MKVVLPAIVSATGLLAAPQTASAASDVTFTLNRGQNLSTLCAGIRQSGVNVSVADCVTKILFANRQWFDERFGYVWNDPASVKLDSAIRMWAGVSYLLPAELVAAKPAQAEPAPQASMAPAETKPIHPAHFDPLGRAPSKFTIELRDGLKATLPFEDQRDFEEAKKGFIAEPPYKEIKADAGHVAWDMGSYQWLLSGKEFESINPSLQRQAVLNMAYGLYEVVPGRVYQVRGYDLANISFIKGDTGWIVFDPLTAKETARAALEFINEKLGKRPVVGVVYSHSHVDHFGGVRGVVDEADVKSGWEAKRI